MARTKTGSTGTSASSQTGGKSATNRRGSPEAIEKRRAARMFNDVLAGRGHGTGPKLDGRTEKRRQRLLRELKEGTAAQAIGDGGSSRELKPLDVLQHVQELLLLGEPLASIRKVVKVKKNAPAVDGIVRIVERLHKAYSFRPEVYRFVGIGEDTLRSAGVLEASGRKRVEKTEKAERKKR